MKTGPTEWSLRQFQVIATAVVLAISGGAVFAQGELARAPCDDVPPFAASAETPRSEAIAISPLSLRASEVLASPGKSAELRSAAKFAAKSGTRPLSHPASPKLRLDRGLAGSGRLQSFVARPTLPQGDLNRTGIVRATAILVRDGGFFLVGDYFDHEGIELSASDAVGRN